MYMYSYMQAQLYIQHYMCTVKVTHLFTTSVEAPSKHNIA